MKLPLIEFVDGMIICNHHHVALMPTVFEDPGASEAATAFVNVILELQATSTEQECDSLDQIQRLPFEDSLALFLAEHSKLGFVPADKLMNLIAQYQSKGEEE